MKKLFLSVALVASAIAYTNAQAPVVADAAKWSVALKGGIDYFNIKPVGTDITDNGSWGAGLSIERTSNPFVGFGLNVDYLNYNRSSITGTTIDPTLFTSLNLSNILQPVRKSAKVNVYSNFGVGASIANYKDAVWGAAGYPVEGDKVSPVATTSLALEANVSRVLALGLEAGYRGYISTESPYVHYNDAYTLMGTLRVKLGTGSKTHVRDMTRHDYAPVQNIIQQVENPYDDSNVINRLDNIDRQNQDVQNRLKQLEDDVKGLKDKAEGEVIKASFDKIEFEFDSSKLTAESKTTLDQIASILLNNKYWSTLTVKGHTDNVGPDAYNQTLSEKRADAVKAYLAGKGLDASAITTAGYGESQPITSNNTAAGRKSNRRVEFEIAK